MRRCHRLVGIALSLSIIALLFGSAPGPATDSMAQATIITVTTFDDEYDSNLSLCSLREAIVSANTDSAFGGCLAGNGDDTISLPAGIYLLNIAGSDEDASASGDLDISSNLVLEGVDAATTIISATSTLADRVIHVMGNYAVSISAVTISGGNTTTSVGGGIRNSDGTVTVRNSVLTKNEAFIDGGGIWNSGTLTITNSTISNNRGSFQGGGIRNYGILSIISTTISDNTASGGGGIANMIGAVSIVNSTISGNSASMGGGIDNQSNLPIRSTIEIFSSTIYSNTAYYDGGGVRGDYSDGPLYLKNTILAGNIDATGGDHPDCASNSQGGKAALSQGYNVIGVGGCINTTPDDQVGSIASPLDPLLGPLQDNGGDIFTHALLIGSPAIDKGTNSECPPTDQRGTPRPQTGICDVGAFEYTFPHRVYVVLIRKSP